MSSYHSWRAIYLLIKRLAEKPSTPNYPEAPNDEALANQFSEFFKTRIDKIKAQFTDQNVSDHATTLHQSNGCGYQMIPVITPEELQKLVEKSPTKSCALDHELSPCNLRQPHSPISQLQYGYLAPL